MALVTARAEQAAQDPLPDGGILSGLAPDRRSGWYVIQVKPRQEGRVLRRLALAAIGTFLPFIETPRRRGGARSRVLEPLFPGYIFVRLPPLPADPAPWGRVRWTPGVVRVLGVGETAVAVPAELVEAIEARTMELGFVRLPSPLSNGVRVRLRSGPFQDLEAMFERPVSRAGRVLVLLQLLGQPTPVEVDEDCLDLV